MVGCAVRTMVRVTHPTMDIRRDAFKQRCSIAAGWEPASRSVNEMPPHVENSDINKFLQECNTTLNITAEHAMYATHR